MSVLRTLLILFILWFPSENYLLQCRGTRISAIENSVFRSVPQVQEFGIQFSSSGSGVRYSVQFLRCRSSVFRNSTLRPIGIQNSALDPTADYRFRNWLSVFFGIQSHSRFSNSTFSPILESGFQRSGFEIQDFGIMFFCIDRWTAFTYLKIICYTVD